MSIRELKLEAILGVCMLRLAMRVETDGSLACFEALDFARKVLADEISPEMIKAAKELYFTGIDWPTYVEELLKQKQQGGFDGPYPKTITKFAINKKLTFGV